jgi:hypothetical protein
MKVERDAFKLLLGPRILDGSARHLDIAACKSQVSAGDVQCGLRRLGRFDRDVARLDQGLPAIVDALGVGVVGFRLGDTGECAIEVGPGLVDIRLRPADTRGLLAGVEAGERGALGHAVAVVGLEVRQHAGHLEPDFRDDARLHRPQAEDLDRHVALAFKDLDCDRTEEQSPAACGDADSREQQTRPEEQASMDH